MATMTEPKAENKTLVHFMVEGGVAIIELDDAPANTYTYEMMRQLDEAILRARFDDDVHVVVLRGHGDKFFSAGANIGMLNSVTPRFKFFFCLHANETLNRLEQTPKLTIAALNGHTVGGGLEIAMACDIRLAKENAGKIGLPEVNLGEADLAGVLLGEPDIARHGDLEPTAHGVPVQCGDRELRRLLQAVEGLVGMQAEEEFEARGHAVQHADVRAGGEELVAVTAQHHHVDVVVKARPQDRLVELTHHLVGVRIGGRVVQLDDRDATFDHEADRSEGRRGGE